LARAVRTVAADAVETIDMVDFGRGCDGTVDLGRGVVDGAGVLGDLLGVTETPEAAEFFRLRGIRDGVVDVVDRLDFTLVVDAPELRLERGTASVEGAESSDRADLNALVASLLVVAFETERERVWLSALVLVARGGVVVELAKRLGDAFVSPVGLAGPRLVRSMIFGPF
jgi:hypothetical protein